MEVILFHDLVHRESEKPSSNSRAFDAGKVVDKPEVAILLTSPIRCSTKACPSR